MSKLAGKVFSNGAFISFEIVDGQDGVIIWPGPVKDSFPAEMFMLAALPEPKEQKVTLLAATLNGKPLEIRETPAPSL